MNVEERENHTHNELEATFPTTISSCGHFLHFGCYDKYLTTIMARVAQNERFQGAFLDVERGHFECPMCKQVRYTQSFCIWSFFLVLNAP